MLATDGVALPEFPSPAHAPAAKDDFFGPLAAWVTLGQFLASCEPPKPEEVVRPNSALGELLKNLSPGSGLKSPGRKEATRPGGHWGYKQGTFIADLDLPARTVTASSTQDWIREDGRQLRRLTLAECAALQGFPPEWEFFGSKTSRFRQVGNAVPSVFGKVLGRGILEVLHAPVPSAPPCSAPFPKYMQGAVEYTLRDHRRNQTSRVRAKQFVNG
jgi:DNA (cytosine-5)-methyltransferase 1